MEKTGIRRRRTSIKITFGNQKLVSFPFYYCLAVLLFNDNQKPKYINIIIDLIVIFEAFFLNNVIIEFAFCFE